MTAKKCHIVLTRPGFSTFLSEEYQARWGLKGDVLNHAAVAFAEKVALPNLDLSVFARQYLPQASRLEAGSQAQTVASIIKKLATLMTRANRRKGRWTLQMFGVDDDAATQRAAQLETALLAGLKTAPQELQRRFCPSTDWQSDEKQADDLLVQVYLPTATDHLWLSTARLAAGISPFVAGAQRMRHRAGAPSRSSSKLDEAFVCLGRSPRPGETAIDLGASPGGWTFILARHGACVTAIDHGALSLPPGKQLNALVTHLKLDGLTYKPANPVDWLCCDMLIGSRQALNVLRRWIAHDWMTHFVVNIKLPQAKPWPVVQEALDLLASLPWAVAKAKHLYHDRQEITLMGSKTGPLADEVLTSPQAPGQGA